MACFNNNNIENNEDDYLIGLQDLATQTVLADGVIGIGDVYRRYCRKNRCGTRVFDKVQGIFLIKSFKRVGIGRTYLSIIKIIYDKIRAFPLQ